MCMFFSSRTGIVQVFMAIILSSWVYFSIFFVICPFLPLCVPPPPPFPSLRIPFPLHLLLLFHSLSYTLTHRFVLSSSFNLFYNIVLIATLFCFLVIFVIPFPSFLSPLVFFPCPRLFPLRTHSSCHSSSCPFSSSSSTVFPISPQPPRRAAGAASSRPHRTTIISSPRERS